MNILISMAFEILSQLIAAFFIKTYSAAYMKTSLLFKSFVYYGFSLNFINFNLLKKNSYSSALILSAKDVQ